ncbi:MAG: hypothetical protein RLZZ237_811, partial [Pseudomonadota bacterium]
MIEKFPLRPVSAGALVFAALLA